MIVAIDGPAGSGKSSTAKAVAARLGFTFLDTGAMYRAITLKAMRLGVTYMDDAALGNIVLGTVIAFDGAPPDVRVFMDGADVSADIRSDDVTRNVSDYCARDVVRQALVEQQRNIAGRRPVVCEGRDVGTVVFPNAEVKIFMSASLEIRAKRRQKDFAAMGVNKSVEELISEMEMRDLKDSTRANSPLTKADNATYMDTTNMTFEEQIEFIVGAVSKRL